MGCPFKLWKLDVLLGSLTCVTQWWLDASVATLLNRDNHERMKKYRHRVGIVEHCIRKRTSNLFLQFLLSKSYFDFSLVMSRLSFNSELNPFWWRRPPEVVINETHQPSPAPIILSTSLNSYHCRSTYYRKPNNVTRHEYANWHAVFCFWRHPD